MTAHSDPSLDRPTAVASFFSRVLHCLQSKAPAEKSVRTKQLLLDWQRGAFPWPQSGPLEDYSEPGRPVKPVLVTPRDLPRRSMSTVQGRAALIHSFAHIEFNAINLALDAVYRFRDMPKTFYADWLHVAAEEAYHFDLLSNHLSALGYVYGDFAAHNGLWDMAMRSKHSVLIRMAIIPRGMEARGLDVTPAIIEKWQASGDEQVVSILQTILHDEIGHVEIGTRWFNYCCDLQSLPRQETFKDIMRRFFKGGVKLPLHRSARKSAGFTDEELDFLEGKV